MNRRSVVLSVAGALVASHLTLAQGPLNPPGPPAPTMQTLEQIGAKTERRIPISSLPFLIEAPGSYYLTGNLAGAAGQNGITVSASHVTIDLNGFGLSGPGTNGVFLQNAVTNVAIRNGSVHDWGNAGILGSTASSVLVENVRTSQNASVGIRVGPNSIIKSCTSSANGTAAGGVGLAVGNGGVISHCTVTGTSGSSSTPVDADFGSLVVDCTARQNTGANSNVINVDGGSSIVRCLATGNTGTSAGINTGANCKVIDSTSSSNGGANNVGIKAGDRSEVRNCTSTQNGGDGILALNDCLLIGNNSSLNGSDGIQLETSSSGTRVEGNTLKSNAAFAIRASSTSNGLIIRNSAGGSNAGGSASEYSFGGNAAGPTLGRAEVTTNTNPNANFDLDAP